MPCDGICTEPWQPVCLILVIASYEAIHVAKIATKAYNEHCSHTGYQKCLEELGSWGATY